MSGKDKRWKHLSAKPPWRWDVPGIYSPEDRLKTTSLIGYKCTSSNVFSLVLLTGREAWPPFFHFHFCQEVKVKKGKSSLLILKSTLFINFSQHLLTYPEFNIFNFFFPVSMAGLQLTFPSRTRSIRGPATMVLHNRVRESSSMPDFFLPVLFTERAFFCPPSGQ